MNNKKTGIPDRDAVIGIIRQAAAAEIMPRFRRLGEGDISEKRPGDLVTTADLEAERHLRWTLRHLAPGSAAIGEEGVERDPDTLRVLTGTAPVWIIYPLDGTHNFAHGKPCFAVIVACCIGGETRAGWIHDPLADLTVWAAIGEGAWMVEGKDRRRLTAAASAAVRDMGGSLVHRLAKRMEGRKDAPAQTVRYRCVGREYMDLARGGLHFARYGGRHNPWDHAASVLIHREAGGHGTLSEGRAPYLPGNGIQTAPLLLAPDAACWDTLAAALSP
jgi:fructose-1,6-bisphosphatase/inositol monophosphatase family enzyme